MRCASTMKSTYGTFTSALALMVVLDTALCLAGPVGSVHLPKDFSFNVPFHPKGGFYQFDTDSLVLRACSGIDLNCSTTIATGEVRYSQSGQTEIAAFAFEDVNIGSNTKITGRGRRPLAIISKCHISVRAGARVDVSAHVGAGPAGFEGAGVSGVGQGPGGGGKYRASGGGYGGPGGGFEGGVTYGDAQIVELVGGSGGGGAWSGRGGGGAILLSAAGKVEIDPYGEVRADGGTTNGCNGGGAGSGGAIIIHAARLENRGVLSARGGTGCTTQTCCTSNSSNPPLRCTARGCGGGGGRVAVFAPGSLGTVDVTGGSGVIICNVDQRGGVGTIHQGPSYFTSVDDLDNDGIFDPCDNCPKDHNPLQEDTDLNDIPDDKVGDACDNCIYLGNPDQADSDNDGRGDACSIPIGDCNRNGVPDACDLSCAALECADVPLAPCATSVDSNSDGMPDECEERNCDRFAFANPFPRPVPGRCSRGLRRGLPCTFDGDCPPWTACNPPGCLPAHCVGDDHLFVYEDESPLACTTRDDVYAGTLTAEIVVDRAFGAAHGNALLCPDDLIANGVVDGYATLTVCAHDVDYVGLPIPCAASVGNGVFRRAG